MSWFFIALIAPLLWSIVNHADKYLLSKYFKTGGVGGLLIFSSISGIAILPVAYFAEPTAIAVSLTNTAILLALGIGSGIYLLLYMYALDREEASVVMPFYQLVPVFGLVLGYLFLGEVLGSAEIIACLAILIGGIILSLDLSTRIPRLKGKLVGLMLGSTSLVALVEVLFKVMALEDSFWPATFWYYAGLVVFGMILFCVSSYRKQFMAVLRDNKKTIFALNAGSEVVTLGGNLAFSFASLLAPIALVMVVSSYQPLFVFIIGILLTVFFPSISKENISRKNLAQKLVAIIIMLVGTYFLYQPF